MEPTMFATSAEAHPRSRPTGVMAILALAITALVTLPAAASTQDVYTISGIAVDEKASDEVAAKEAALASGKAEALRQLLARIVPDEDFDRFPVKSGQSLEALIRDVSIAQERFGGGRYLATLTVRFLPDAVRRVLKDADIPFAETTSRPVLVLPVYQVAGATLLWDDGNAWFDAWARQDPPVGLLPFVLPLNDLSDVARISAQQAMAGNLDRLEGIALKYGTAGSMVVVAKLSRDVRDSAPTLDLTMRIFGPGWESEPWSQALRTTADEPLDDLLSRAVAATSEAAQEVWKRRNILRFDRQQIMTVLIPLDGLADWVAIQAALADTVAISQAAVAQITIDQAEIDLAFVGEIEQLQVALAQRDLHLSYSNELSRWVLFRRQRPSPMGG